MKKFVIRDREGGNEVTWFPTLKEAEEQLEEYEREDKAEGIFTENFFVIREEDDEDDE